jgi:two-component system nitrogen regulation sensor histidine kinase GlnL
MQSGSDFSAPIRATLDELSTPLLLCDNTGIVRHANAACATWLGVSPRRLTDVPLDSLGPDGARLTAALARVAASGERAEVRAATLMLVSDEERYADVYATPFNAFGVDTAVAFEFHPRAEYPGDDPARRLPEALSAALGGLAHELRNPLAGLRGAAQLLLRHAGDGERRYGEVILAEADRLLALIERLLTPVAPRVLVPTNLHEVIERVRLLAESEAEWSAVIQRDYDPSLPETVADPDRLAQAVWNLVRNALQAGATEVRLRTRAERHVLIGEREHRLAFRLDIADNGRGVPPELAERIFLPLVTSRAEGTGLGLALAQAVAREHGGILSYRSRPGHTVFTLLLPIATEPKP